MEIRFDGRTILITGAGSGIGAATARELAASGAEVVLSDLTDTAAEGIAAEIRASGGRARAFAADVSRADQVAALVEFASSGPGGLYGLVNNAGISGTPAPTGAHDPEAWQRVIDVNLSGVFYGMRHALPKIAAAGGGAVVNVASILGSVGFANSVGYVSAKHGVVGATKAAALEYATQNIRINSVGPGFIRTPLIEHRLSDDYRRSLEARHPMGRLGTAEEVADLIVYLLSDRAGFITGACYQIDGGYTAQ